MEIGLKDHILEGNLEFKIDLIVWKFLNLGLSRGFFRGLK